MGEDKTPENHSPVKNVVSVFERVPKACAGVEGSVGLAKRSEGKAKMAPQCWRRGFVIAALRPNFLIFGFSSSPRLAPARQHWGAELLYCVLSITQNLFYV